MVKANKKVTIVLHKKDLNLQGQSKQLKWSLEKQKIQNPCMMNRTLPTNLAKETYRYKQIQKREWMRKCKQVRQTTKVWLIKQANKMLIVSLIKLLILIKEAIKCKPVYLDPMQLSKLIQNIQEVKHLFKNLNKIKQKN